jgi:hypothetical protein
MPLVEQLDGFDTWDEAFLAFHARRRATCRVHRHRQAVEHSKGVLVTAPTVEINTEVIEQKIGVVFGALGGLVTSSMIHIGNELGLYRAMAGKGPITAARRGQPLA